MGMRIGELAKATGVDVETIRYYEKAQLLSAPARSDNGYRVIPKLIWNDSPSSAIAGHSTSHWLTYSAC